MAESLPSPETLESNNPQTAEPDDTISYSNQTDLAPTSDPLPPPSNPLSSAPASTAITQNPYLNPPLVSPLPAPPSLSFAPTPTSGTVVVPPTALSFRPVPLSAQHFSPVRVPGLPNQSYGHPGLQPPGLSASAAVATGGAGVPQSLMPYQVQNPALRSYAPMPNGYGVMPTAVPQGTVPPGVARFPSPYPAMIRVPFPPRPPGVLGMVPAMPRPLVPGIPGIRPMITPIVRPGLLPSVTPAEKPQTTVYIGRIAQTVENDFMLSLLQFCGPVKSWKRVQDPTDGKPRTFGFCEFESAEGVLRALRLLTKFNIDGQELALKGTQATRKYLKCYVEKKTENSKKPLETQAAEAKEEEGGGAGVERNEASKSTVENSKEDNDSGANEDHDIAYSAIVTDEDREADKEALEKLTNAIEERLKTNPLPPPPPPPPPPQAPVDGTCNSSAEPSTKLRDGDSDTDMMRNDANEDKNDNETTIDHNQTSEHDKPETSSPDRSRRYDRKSRERDRERDLKREKDREIERYERETERERIRKEREQRRKIEDAERQYEECLKEWEYREREREKQRQYEKEREKERERKRKKEVIYDEDDDEEEDSRKRWRRSVIEEKRKRRLREKEDDLADRQREEEEQIAEAKKKAEEEEQQQKQQRDALKLLSDQVKNFNQTTNLPEESTIEIKENAVDLMYDGDSGHENHIGDGIFQNGSSDESTLASTNASDVRQGAGNVPTKRLGFGLVGSGKRTSVPSVFHEEEDDDAHKDKKMRPLVPIDYSADEIQAVQPTVSGAPAPNLAAAAEFAKRLSNPNSREEKPNTEKERGRRSGDKSSHRDRNDEDTHRSKDGKRYNDRDRDRDREHGLDKVKTADNKKLLDAKQLIDMIPKTKEELFSYEVNWAIYDKHELHERMRPWISKKITEFLGEEEATLVDYIVSSTQEHVKASQMLELLQSILDEEAEMFVLKMWRMLIFEIKKVETGLAVRSKT